MGRAHTSDPELLVIIILPWREKNKGNDSRLCVCLFAQGTANTSEYQVMAWLYK